MVNLKLSTSWDLELNPVTHNLDLAEGNDYTTQKIQQDLQRFLSEWFEDTTLGIDWRGILLGQVRPDISKVKASITVAIAKVSGVQSVVSVTIDAPNVGVEATITFSALLMDGATINGSIAL